MRAPAKKKFPTEPFTKSNFGPSVFAAVTWEWKCRILSGGRGRDTQQTDQQGRPHGLGMGQKGEHS